MPINEFASKFRDGEAPARFPLFDAKSTLVLGLVVSIMRPKLVPAAISAKTADVTSTVRKFFPRTRAPGIVATGTGSTEGAGTLLSVSDQALVTRRTTKPPRR
jgi:hypothetical protein